MTDPRIDKLIDGLKKLVDEFEPRFRRHGPMRVQFTEPPFNEEAPWTTTIESGWDHNYGGRVHIVSSKTGKSLRVFRDGKELK